MMFHIDHIMFRLLSISQTACLYPGHDLQNAVPEQCAKPSYGRSGRSIEIQILAHVKLSDTNEATVRYMKMSCFSAQRINGFNRKILTSKYRI